MKKTLLATTALAFIAASASAVDVEMYGQVSKGVFAFDDGQNTDFVVGDNDNNSTRLGVKGAQALDNGLTASMLFEGEMNDNNSSTFTQNATAGQSSTPANSAAASFTSRQARVGLSGNFGGVYVGKQSTAFDGVIDQDLVGAADVMNIDIANIGGGLNFRTAAGGLTADSVADLAGTHSQNRANSVRYDSPIFAGFQGRASVAQGGDLEASVFYAGQMGDFNAKAAAGVAFVNDEATTATNRDDVVYGASASLAHNSGVAATLGYTQTELESKTAGVDEPSKWYGKVGYAWDAFEVAADYSTAEGYLKTAAKGDLDSYGLGAQYNMGNGVSLGALYRNFDAEIAGSSTDSIDLYGVTMRVKF